MELKNRHKKCINFDLDTKELLKYFPKGTRKPYALIKEFFEKQGFDHRQYSGYISKEPISDYKLTKIIHQLSIQYIWLKNCIKEFDVSNAPQTLSLKNQIYNSIEREEKKIYNQFIQKLRYYQSKKKILNSSTRIKYEKELLNLYQKLEKNHINLDEKSLKSMREIAKTKSLKR
ncbi:hypothetical protein CYI58_08670 [Campylobacter upsaliensis]|nr:hypothetical protein [Campylobacter upsaliensis]